MLKRGANGTAVEELQEMLLAIGYKLPRWGADGDLGNETLDAVAHFCADHAWPGYADSDRDVVTDGELATIQRCYEAVKVELPLPGLEFHDMRKSAARDCVGGRRMWSDITGITLHQVAVDFGHERPDRWDTLHAHVGTSREGHVFWCHDFEFVVWHGNELNGPTVGIECEGNYCGVAGDVSTLWQPANSKAVIQVPTPELVKATQDAIRWVCRVVEQHNGKVRNLYAHRQTAASRRADPGAELWAQVALPMMTELGLSDGGPAFVIDNGRPIPQAWNPAYTAKY